MDYSLGIVSQMKLFSSMKINCNFNLFFNPNFYNSINEFFKISFFYPTSCLSRMIWCFLLNTKTFDINENKPKGVKY